MLCLVRSIIASISLHYCKLAIAHVSDSGERDLLWIVLLVGFMYRWKPFEILFNWPAAVHFLPTWARLLDSVRTAYGFLGTLAFFIFRFSPVSRREPWKLEATPGGFAGLGRVTGRW